MNRKVNLILIAVLCDFLQLTYGQTCKTCLPASEASCESYNTYRLCQGGIPLTAIQTCPSDYVCTDSENICEPKVKADGTSTVAACSTSCDRCPDATAANKKYACVSKTQFGRCVNGDVAVVGSCAADTYCSAEIYAKTGKICASQCVMDYFGVSATCNNDETTTTTTTTTTAAPATTPSIQSLKAQCNAAPLPYARYFYVRNKPDTECKTYIYCEPSGDEMDAYLIKCRSGFFDSTKSKCVATKPAECNIVEDLPSTTLIPTDAPTNAPTEESTGGTTNASTEEPTGGTTDPPTEITTEGTTYTPTEESTEGTTDAPTEAPTGGTTDSSTEITTDDLTEESTGGTTDPLTETPTDDPTEDESDPSTAGPIVP